MNNTSLHRSALVLGLASFASACAVAMPEDGNNGSLSQASFLDPDRVAELKSIIIDISTANQTREDNFADVSAELAPYIDELVALTPPRSDDETLSLLAGSWYQLWSNLENMGPRFIRMDRAKIFQVVSPDNHYYNFGQSKVAGIFNTIGVLRGKYELSKAGASAFNVEFTKTGFLFGKIRPSTDLVDLAIRIESGDKNLRSFGDGQAPNGPVGITGQLTTLYVDEDLRIAGGGQDVFVDEATGEVVEGREHLLFVLVRGQ